MKHYFGTEKVEGGFYVDPITFDITVVSGKTGTLPGDKMQEYVHLPAGLFMLLAPALGGALVLFLPFVGFVFVFRELRNRFIVPVNDYICARG